MIYLIATLLYFVAVVAITYAGIRVVLWFDRRQRIRESLARMERARRFYSELTDKLTRTEK